MNTSRESLQRRMQAALDNELDAANLVEFETSLAEDPALAAQFRTLKALQETMRDKLPAPKAPDALRARMADLGGVPARVIQLPGASAMPQRANSRGSWMSYAATALLAAGLASVLTLTVSSPQRADIGDQIIASHRRSLLAASPVDVVSSDKHTVKPWFDARLARSPQVVDLGPQGYELVGGRTDIVGAAPSPTFVYRLREHLISVTAIAPSRDAILIGRDISRYGYRTQNWRDGDFTYWATSDIDRADLDTFIAAFQHAADATR